MNIKIVSVAAVLLIVGLLYFGYRYQFSNPEMKRITPEERIALQKNMTIKEILEQAQYSVQVWRGILQETSLYDQLGDANRSFILFLMTDEIMVAPLIPTQAARDNLLEKWHALTLNKKIEIAKNYIIATEKPWRPEVGTQSFTTLGGRNCQLLLRILNRQIKD